MKPLINVNFQDVAVGLIDDKDVSIEELAYKCGVSVNIIKHIHSGKTKKVEHSCGNRMIYEWECAYFREYG